MKAEFKIDTQELAKEIAQEVVRSLLPLLQGKTDCDLTMDNFNLKSLVPPKKKDNAPPRETETKRKETNKLSIESFRPSLEQIDFSIPLDFASNSGSY